MGSIAIATWMLWLTFLGPQAAITALIRHWAVALTMVFGSIIAGGTSMGGGAVAFPVFTKLLHIAPNDAKVFSLAIQSVGMSAAALALVLTQVRVEWRIIRWVSLGDLLGISLGSLAIAPWLATDALKICFTAALTSFAIVLLVFNRSTHQRYLTLPICTLRERRILIGTGILGGILSGLVGNGIDIVAFAVMVLLFRISERVATPTSVILMAINAIVGFALHALVLQDFAGSTQGYWLAAIPVVVVGAPLGAMVCSYLNRQTVANVVISLIFIELTTSLIMVPLRAGVAMAGLAVLMSCFYLTYWMCSNHRYAVPITHPQRPETMRLRVPPESKVKL